MLGDGNSENCRKRSIVLRTRKRLPIRTGLYNYYTTVNSSTRRHLQMDLMHCINLKLHMQMQLFNVSSSEINCSDQTISWAAKHIFLFGRTIQKYLYHKYT